jgi:hypothetical protein
VEAEHSPCAYLTETAVAVLATDLHAEVDVALMFATMVELVSVE